MGYQQASREAYEEAKKNLGDKQAKVLRVLMKAHSPMTNAEVAYKLDWPINRVTPRMKELRDRQLVVGHGRRHCTVSNSNVRANQWWVNSIIFGGHYTI